MGKILNTYNGLSASQIIAKASNTCTMTLAGSTVDCTNITTTKIKSVLGASSNSVSALCQHSGVNKYSGFSPVEWYISGTDLYNRVKTPYTMGSFAGYNHSAVTPAFIGKTTNAAVYDFPVPLTITAYFEAGELNYAAIDGNISKVVLKVYDGLTEIGSSSVSLSSINGSYILNCPITYGWSSSHTLNAKLFLANNVESIIAYLPIPNSAWTIPVTSYYNVVITHTFTIGSLWLETPMIVKNAATSITKSTGDFIMSYDLSRFPPNDFLSNVTINLEITLQRNTGNGYTTIASGTINNIVTSGYGDPQHFYYAGRLNSLAGFPSELMWGDQLYFRMNRVSGGF